MKIIESGRVEQLILPLLVAINLTKEHVRDKMNKVVQTKTAEKSASLIMRNKNDVIKGKVDWSILLSNTVCKRRDYVFQKFNGKCAYCGCNLEFDSFHVDHVFPKSKSVTHEYIYFPACQECNMAKGNLSLEEFRYKIESYIDSFPGKIIDKYYKIKRKEIVFYFEKINGI